MKTCIRLFFIVLLALQVNVFQAGAAEKTSDKAYATILQEIDERGETSVLVELTSPDFRLTGNEDIPDEKRTSIVAAMQQRLASSLSADDRQRVVHSYQYVAGVVMRVNRGALTRLQKNENVKAIYKNGRRKPSLMESTKLVFPDQATSEFTGNNEWAVAVLDSGVDKNHSFLKTGTTRKVVSEACYSRGGYPVTYPEIDSFCPGEGFASTAVNSGLYCMGYDGCYHGTHVAGIAAGNGTSFNGIARLGRVIAIQVFTGIRDYFYSNVCGIGYGQNCIVAFDSDILKGLERVYALRNTYKIAAVNMSLGGGEFADSCDYENYLVTQIIADLKASGIATVVASGNDKYTSSISWPACISDAIAVGATYDSGASVDQPAPYSNESDLLDLYAPGSEIYSSFPGGSFETLEGTSMAAPHVAGALAVMKHAKPDATVAELENVLKSVGPNVPTRNNQWTRKRLDVQSALEKLVHANINMVPILNLLRDGQKAGAWNILMLEKFESWPPYGWSIVNNGGNCAWESTGEYGYFNYAGGSGNAASANADMCGASMNTDLITPVFDLSSSGSATLTYVASYFDWFDDADYADVSISTNGGTSWTPLLRWEGVDHDAYGPGEKVTINLTPYAGSSQTRLRFRYYAPDWDFWWMIDDVTVTGK